MLRRKGQRHGCLEAPAVVGLKDDAGHMRVLALRPGDRQRGRVGFADVAGVDVDLKYACVVRSLVQVVAEVDVELQRILIPVVWCRAAP